MRREHHYILCIWSDSDGETVWRASLENLRTKEKFHFKNLEDLQTFLHPWPDRHEKEPGSSDATA